MRLLYYTTSYYANHGGSIQAIELYNNLKENKHIDALEIFPDERLKKGIPSKKNSFNYKKILKKSRLFQLLSFYRRNQFYETPLFRKIKSFNPDVILVQIDSNFLQIHNIKKRFPELKICTQINGSPFDESYINIAFKDYFLKIQKETYQISDINFFISDVSRNQIMRHLTNEQRDIVVHNGTDVKKFYPIRNKLELRKKLSYQSEKFIIGYVGTLDYHKKIDILVTAYSTFYKKEQDTILVIIGDGPAYNSLSNLIKRLGLQNSVQLTGWIEHDRINEYINCFDIAIHHYANNYMNPLKIFEYISAGIPVVAPDIPTVHQYFNNNEDLLITSGTEKDLFNRIELLYYDEKKRKSLSSRSNIIKIMQHNFTWKNYSDKIVKEIKELF